MFQIVEYLIDFIINFNEKGKTLEVHLQLPIKKTSLHIDSHLTPHKNPIRTQSPGNTDNQNRNFFQNMKSELHTIKQDF